MDFNALLLRRQGLGTWILGSIFLIVLATHPSNISCDADVAGAQLDALLKNYDRRFRPNYNGSSVQVNVTAYILSMPEIDSSLMTFTLNLYFRQSWFDNRLASNPPNDEIVLDALHYDKIWIPDTFFTNELSSSEHDVTVPNVLLRISPDGKVLKSVRYTVQLSCPMNYQNFPFDRQTCALECESFAFTASGIKYHWAKANQSIGVAAHPTINEFKLLGYRLSDTQISISSGNYSRLFVEFKFRRMSGRYFVEFYLPCIFLTSLSLMSLFLSDARLAILINILTMGFTIVFLSISSGLMEIPKISYMTALDAYSAITNIFIFISLSVSILTFYLSRKGKRPERIELSRFGVPSSSGNRAERLEDDEVNLCSNQQPNSRPLPESLLQSIIKMVEEVLAFIMPFLRLAILGANILTNIIYWSVYPNASNDSTALEDWIKHDVNA